MALDKELMEFLLTGSRNSLKRTFLTHLAESRNLRKEIADKLDALLEENALLVATEWFLAHGETLAAKLSGGENRPSPSDLPPLAQPFALPRAFNRPLGIKKPRTWRKIR